LTSQCGNADFTATPCDIYAYPAMPFLSVLMYHVMHSNTLVSSVNEHC